MKYDLIEKMCCPYCTGSYKLVKNLKQTGNRINYGLVECNCFEFPIVDSVLLLSLTKGYGGSEDDLFPYEAFLAAAITYIKQDDLAGLQGWIEEKIPALADLIYKDDIDFVNYDVNYTKHYNTYNCEFLHEQKKKFDVVGETIGQGVPVDSSGQSLYPESFEDMLYRKMGDGGNYYVKRYFDPSVSVTRNFLLNNPPEDYLLSLCFGHGVFENIARDHVDSDKMISLDAQLINIYLVKRFINPNGIYICHNLYFPLPFKSGFLSAVFTSTCLPELVTQAQVFREIDRVTAPDGWAYIEHVWTGKEVRLDPSRYYRYMQNQFESFDHYLELLNNTCSTHRTKISSYKFSDYKLGVVAEPELLSNVLSIDDDSTDVISVLLSSSDRVIGDSAVDLTASELKRLRLSPMFDVLQRDNLLCGIAKQEFKDYMQQTLPDSFEMDLTRIDDSSYLTDLYGRGVLLLLPALLAERFPALDEIAVSLEVVA